MNRFLFHLVQAAFVLTLVSPVPAALAAPAGPDGAGAAYFAKGRQLVAEGRAPEGFDLLAAAVAVAPDNIVYQTYLLTYLDRAAFNWQVALLERVHAVAPGYPPVLQRLAKLYEGKGRHAEAEALYLQWAALRPDQPEPYARLGEHYYFTGQYDKGLKAFARHRELVGESDYALRRMAAIHQEMGNPSAAADLFARTRAIMEGPEGALVMAGPGTPNR